MLAEKPHSFGRSVIIPSLTGICACGYIFVVNATILGDPRTGMPQGGVATATVLTAIIATLLGGLLTRNPFLIASGMGLNVSVAGLSMSGVYTWPEALTISFLGGFIQFALFAFFPPRIRNLVLTGIPRVVKIGMVTGIAAMLMRYALDRAYYPFSLTPTHADPLSLALSFLGFAVIVTLHLKGGLRTSLASLTGIAFVTIAAISLDLASLPSTILALPDFSTVREPTFTFLTRPADALAAILTAVMLALATTLDDIATLETLSAVSGDELRDTSGQPRGLVSMLRLTGFTTALGGILGTSAQVPFLENIAVVLSGGRGRAVAVAMAILMLPFLFLSPLLALIPSAATASVLLFVSLMMFLSFIDFCREYPAFRPVCEQGNPLVGVERHESLLSALLPVLACVATMQYFGGIGVGVMFGFVTYALTHTVIVRDWQRLTAVQWGYATVSLFGLVAHFAST